MIRVIQVGYGYWGESWVQYLRDDPNFELAALVVRTEETLQKARVKWKLPNSICFTDYDEALKLDADLVIIVMPHYAHIEFARKAVEAGKNVLIEKPLCDDMDEAKEFAKWMRGRSERVFVSHNYRYREELWRCLLYTSPRAPPHEESNTHRRDRHTELDHRRLGRRALLARCV